MPGPRGAQPSMPNGAVKIDAITQNDRLLGLLLGLIGVAGAGSVNAQGYPPWQAVQPEHAQWSGVPEFPRVMEPLETNADDAARGSWLAEIPSVGGAERRVRCGVGCRLLRRPSPEMGRRGALHTARRSWWRTAISTIPRRGATRFDRLLKRLQEALMVAVDCPWLIWPHLPEHGCRRPAIKSTCCSALPGGARGASGGHGRRLPSPGAYVCCFLS